MRAGLRLLFNGDASQWDRAMQLPHYNTRSMPAVSVHTGLHLIQASPQSLSTAMCVPAIDQPPQRAANYAVDCCSLSGHDLGIFMC